MRPVLGTRPVLVTARAAARRMAEHGSGVILWLTSGSATGAAPGMGGTGPADALTDNHMRQLARETGRQGVRVCGIWTAGVYETFMLDRDSNVNRRASGITAEGIDRMIGGMAALGRAAATSGGGRRRRVPRLGSRQRYHRHRAERHRGAGERAVSTITESDLERRRREIHVHYYRMLANYQEAEDAVQEAYMRAWQARSSFGGERMDAKLSLAAVREDIRITMPPNPMCFEGRAQMAELFETARQMGKWRLLATATIWPVVCASNLATYGTARPCARDLQSSSRGGGLPMCKGGRVRRRYCSRRWGLRCGGGHSVSQRSPRC
jgi:hypothetical protein